MLLLNKKKVYRLSNFICILFLILINGNIYGQAGNASCNTVEPLVTATFDQLSASITDDVPETIIVPICVGGISNIGNLIDANPSNVVEIEMTGLDCEAEIAVADANDVYPSGTFAGFKISSDGLLLDAGIAAAVEITTYNSDSVGVMETYIVSSSTVGIDVDLLDDDGNAIVGFITTKPFDEVRIKYDALVSVLFDAEVHYAVIKRFCAGPVIGCNELNPISAPEYPIFINPELTGVNGALCALCGVVDSENIIDNDGSNYAEVNVTAGVLSTVGVAVKNQLDVYPANTFTGFDIENLTLLDATILDNITINTYNDGTLVETQSGQNSLVATGTDILTTDGRQTVGFVSSQPFDEVQIEFKNFGAVDIGLTRIYGVIFSQFCARDVICDTTYFLTNTNFPVIIDGAETGKLGLACAASSVQNAPNVINANTSDFGEISIAAGVACSGSIAVVDILNDYPSGSKAGYVIEVTDQVLINLGLQLFDAITISTYNNGTLQESKTGSDLIDVELLVLFINNADGRYNIGFETSLVYDEIKIEIGSLAALTNKVNVYAAYVDTRGANGDGFQCCPVDIPELSSNEITNSCPVKTADLNSLETSSAPLNATLVWYTNNTHTGNAYSSPSNATAGTYYAYYYDSVNDCFTHPTEQVTVTVNECSDLGITMTVDESTPNVGDTIEFTLVITNVGPDDATNVFGTDTLPFGYEYISSVATQGSYDEVTGLWTVGGITTGNHETLTISVVVNDTTDYVNVAHTFSDNVDFDLSNNTTSDSVTPAITCATTGAFIHFDCDNDGLTNIEEITGVDNPNTIPDPNGILTDPDDPDSDGDGVSDGDEAIDLTNPNDACDFNPASITLTPDVDATTLDCDGDGVTNVNELLDMTNPLDPCEFLLTSVTQNATSFEDCDGDGVPLHHEVNGLDNDFATLIDNTNPFDSCDFNIVHQDSLPSAAWMLADCDGDGVKNINEYTGLDGDPDTQGDNTHPLDPCSLHLNSVSQNATNTGDCDGDGVTNADEINGIDDDYSTPNDNTDPLDHCDYNINDISLAVTADLTTCNSYYAQSDINTTTRGVSVSGNVLLNDHDPEGDDFQLTKVLDLTLNFLPSGNSLFINSDGSYLFSPALNFTGDDTFFYRACDEGVPQVCDTASVTITVLDAPMDFNNPPTIMNDNGIVSNDQSLTGNVLANDSDIDGDLIEFSQVLTAPSNGAISFLSDGSFTYNPTPGYVGSEVIEYEACDDMSPMECGSAYLYIDVIPPNDDNEFYANDDAAILWANSSINVPVLDNDTDPEGDGILVPVVISGPSSGQITIESDSTITYSPNPNFSGNDRFVYKTCDEGTPSVCDSATVYLTTFNRLCIDLNLRAYLEGALKDNGGEVVDGKPLMRDDLRSCPFIDSLGMNFIPISEPYSDLPNFTHVGSGGGEIAGENAFNDEGRNSIVDWVFLEFRHRLNAENVLFTRSALLQRDGDIVDVDGSSQIEICGLTNAFHYVVVRHRNHLGAMSQAAVPLGQLIDFTSGISNLGGVFDYGTNHPLSTTDFDYSGLAMKNHSLYNVQMLWAGNANGDHKIKYQAPGDDIFKIVNEVLLHPGNPGFSYNFDKAIGYYSGDTDMNSKVKLQAPGDDSFFIFSQLLTFPLNPTFNYNFNVFLEQIK